MLEDRAREINPDVSITSVSADYDLNKQVSQIDNFIAAGVDIIMLNAVDDEAIAPAVMRAKQAGIVVSAFDVSEASFVAGVVSLVSAWATRTESG